MTESPQTYRLIAEQSYDTIPREVGLQMELNSHVRELKFVKVEGLKLMYDTYVLGTSPSPSLGEGSRVVAVGRTRELADLLQREFSDRGRLPSEVRIIRPNLDRDHWGIFVRR